MTDYIREYWELIRSGQETVGQKVRAVYREIIRELDAPGDYYYDEKRAEHALRFISQFCRQSKGKDGGKPMQLLLWQKSMICMLFGILDADGRRRFRELFLVVGRKNGKSTLASGIGLYMLFADAENGPEVYSVATTRDQAKLSWNEAKKMINKSPSLKKRARPLVGEILTDFNDGVFRPLAADSNTLDGLNPSAAIMDEIAAWKQGQALYDVIIDGESARDEPLNIMITTAGTVREDIFDTLYERTERLLNSWKDPEGTDFLDEHFLPLVYELDNRKEWTDEAAWKKANPSLGPVKSVEALRSMMLRLRDEGVHCIDLVTPTHYLRAVREALEGLELGIPVVWNSSGYESVDALRTLEGLVQVYLPDYKYSDAALAKRYSAAPGYPEIAAAAIREMYRQTGPFRMDENGLLVSGVLIRHLILPGEIENSMGAIDFVSESFPPGSVLFSLMSQYTPIGGPEKYPALQRRVDSGENEHLIRYMRRCGLTDGYWQETSSATEEQIPAFDGTGVVEP